MERARAAARTRLLAPVFRSRAAGERRRGPRLSRGQERRLRAARQPLAPFQLSRAKIPVTHRKPMPMAAADPKFSWADLYFMSSLVLPFASQIMESSEKSRS